MNDFDRNVFEMLENMQKEKRKSIHADMNAQQLSTVTRLLLHAERMRCQDLDKLRQVSSCHFFIVTLHFLNKTLLDFFLST